MSRRVRFATAALLPLLVGCKQDIPIADVASGIAPLSELAGVRLGMRADSLLRVRPAARVASYYGYDEELPRWRISYEVPGSVQDHQAPPRSSHLESVIASDSLAETPDPLLQWQAKVRAVTEVAGTKPACYRVHWPQATAWLAVWQRGGVELFVLGAPLIRESRGGVTPPTLRIGVVRSGQAVPHTYSSATKTDCGRAGDVDSSTSRSTSQ